MQRDGQLTSLWQTIPTKFYPRHHQVPGSAVDIVIAGGGITGITTALLLQKAGKSCVLVEAYNLGFGTTGGTTAHINSFLDTDYDTITSKFGEADARLVAIAVKEACTLIKKQVMEYKIDCGYEELPAWIYSRNEDQSEQLEKILKASNHLGVKGDYTTYLPSPVPYFKAAQMEDQAQFDPISYLYALAKAFEDEGGVILEDCRVLSVEDNKPLMVNTSKGIIRCGKLIYATHIPPGVNLVHMRCEAYRSYVIAARLRNETDYPDGMLYDMEDPYHYFRTQKVNGLNYLIAGGEDHKTAHENNPDNCFRKLEAHVKEYYDVVNVPYKWSSQYYEPADGLPYIGEYPGHSGNILIATGFSGNGMTYSHLSALLLHDMIIKEESPYQKLFSPSRIKPVAGFSNFIKEQADVAKQLIGGLFKKEELEAFVDLAPDEGRVVNYEGKKLAVYKDPEGNVHALNPVCPHLKCVVDWNGSEKSWDCPCHGSRFNIDGELLTGPSFLNLEQINLNEAVEK